MGSHTSGITSITYSFLRNIMTCVRNIIQDFLKKGFQQQKDYFNNQNQNFVREQGERLRMEIAYLNECDLSCLQE